jgi:hypothetical protein
MVPGPDPAGRLRTGPRGASGLSRGYRTVVPERARTRRCP